MRLHEAAERRWRKRCPCCEQPMSKPDFRAGKPQPPTMRTRGHDQSVAAGGDSTIWLYMCHRCNNEQGWLSLAAWCRLLVLRGDPRAELVAEVARFIAAWKRDRRMAA